MDQNEKHSRKLRKEREGAANTVHSPRTEKNTGPSASADRKKAAQRRQIRREADASRARVSKLRFDEDGTSARKTNAAAQKASATAGARKTAEGKKTAGNPG